MGPGQRFAVAIIEVCSRLTSRGNTLTLRWVLGLLGIEGNEIADDWAKRAAEGLGDSVPKAYLWRVTEARATGAGKWIVDHVNRRPAERPETPKGAPSRAQGPRGPLLPALVGVCGHERLLV